MMKGYAMGKNSAVSKMISLNITGNVISPSWFQHVKLESGKPDTIAIMLLGDIVYWYRPMEVRNEETGQFVCYRKKFAADKLQRSYGAFAEMYGYTKNQVGDALKRLESLGVIDLDFRHPTINGIKLGNVLFIGLNVDRLSEITIPLSSLNGIGSGEEMADPPAFKDDTNTEITTETSQNEIDKPDAQIFNILESMYGGLRHDTPRFVDTWLEKHPFERVIQAINIAKSKGNKPIQYIDSILIGWEANGYPKTREEQVNERRNDKATEPKAYDGIRQFLAEQGVNNG